MQRLGVVRVSVVIGSLFVILVAPVVASSFEAAVPAAESGGLRSLARELQPNAAQARGMGGADARPEVVAAAEQKPVEPTIASVPPESMTVSIDCDDRACVISSGLVVQVVAAAPIARADRPNR